MLTAALELGEVRLLREARAGNPVALAELWEGTLDASWSIARALLDEADAVRALGQVKIHLQRHAHGLDAHRPFRDQVLQQLWLELDRRVQPSDGERIETPRSDVLAAPSRSRHDDARERMQAELARAPKLDRMIYLFHLVGRCPSEAIARYSGLAEGDVRKTRTRLAFRLVMATRS